MANAEHVSRLKQGVEAWNQWRQENWNVRPNLAGLDLNSESGLKRTPLWDSQAKRIDLSGINLAGADLSDATLKGAVLHAANLAEANLSQANLRKIDLSAADLRAANLNGAVLDSARLANATVTDATLKGADLSRAVLTGADFEGARLEEARLTRADLRFADLSRANLYKADLRAANLQAANLDHAGVIGIRYDRRSMRGRYQGVRGVESVYGDAIFRRDVLDQDYIDTLASRWRRSPRLVLLWLWGLIDYGRSFARILWIALGFVLAFGVLYATQPEHVAFSAAPVTWYTPFLSSLIIFSTLGFADPVIPLTARAQILIASEVATGYLVFSLLVSVLLFKISRRS